MEAAKPLERGVVEGVPVTEGGEDFSSELLTRVDSSSSGVFS